MTVTAGRQNAASASLFSPDELRLRPSGSSRQKTLALRPRGRISPEEVRHAEDQKTLRQLRLRGRELSARFNFRYSTEWTHGSLREKVESVFAQHDIDYELKWHLSGEPFLTQPGKLIDRVSQAVSEQTGSAPELSTGGGTSDGRFIAPAGVDVVELGPVNASIHKIDEHVSVPDVLALTRMYQRIMELMLL